MPNTGMLLYIDWMKKHENTDILQISYLFL